MAQERSSDIVSPLVYPQYRGPRIIVWFMACWIGFIGAAFVAFSLFAIPSAVRGEFHGPAAVPVIFLLIGLGVVTASLAMVLYRDNIVIDPRTRTVVRHRTWGPIRRTLLAGQVSSVRLMHDTHGGGNKNGGFFTVCALKLVTRNGEFWHLGQRPESGEAMRNMLPAFRRRDTPDYEQLIRDEALKLCAATGWRLDDRLDRSATGFVPAASAPQARYVEQIDSRIDAPTWLQRPAPRPVRRNRQTALLSALGWGVILAPLIASAFWVGERLQDARSIRTISGHVIGLAHDGSGRPGVGYRFAANDHEYTNWEWNVPAGLWAAAQKRGSIQVSYLPRDPHHCNLGPSAAVDWLPENPITRGMKLVPLVFVEFAILGAMRRRGRRIARAMLLGERGHILQGMVFRRAQKAGRMRASAHVAINGVTVYNRKLPVEDDPNQVRYEFVVDGRKHFGYVPADLLGVFRPDGLVGVVYDPIHPQVHLPLPVIERYLSLE